MKYWNNSSYIQDMFWPNHPSKSRIITFRMVFLLYRPRISFSRVEIYWKGNLVKKFCRIPTNTYLWWGTVNRWRPICTQTDKLEFSGCAISFYGRTALVLIRLTCTAPRYINTIIIPVAFIPPEAYIWAGYCATNPCTIFYRFLHLFRTHHWLERSQ